MNREKRFKPAITGLLMALCVVLLVAQNAWAQTENNNSKYVILLKQEKASDPVHLTGPDSENQDANTSRTIVLEIGDGRTQESPHLYLSLALMVLLLLVFSLLLVHILMHHTREDGESATTPLPSLQGEDPNPIEESKPRRQRCEEESFSMPLALSVLEASERDHGPGASTRVPSMGYPIGHWDLPFCEEPGPCGMDGGSLEGVLSY